MTCHIPHSFKPPSHLPPLDYRPLPRSQQRKEELPDCSGSSSRSRTGQEVINRRTKAITHHQRVSHSHLPCGVGDPHTVTEGISHLRICLATPEILNFPLWDENWTSPSEQKACSISSLTGGQWRTILVTRMITNSTSQFLHFQSNFYLLFSSYMLFFAKTFPHCESNICSL